MLIDPDTTAMDGKANMKQNTQCTPTNIEVS